MGEDVRISRLVRRIAFTRVTEIDCGECAELSPQYVEASFDGQDGTDRWILVRAHLEQCTVCSQELLTLRSVVKMDVDDTWPTLDQLLDWATRGEPNA